MVMATRILNMVSGVIILVTGIYVGLAFADLLSAEVRLLIACAAVCYFFVRFISLLNHHAPPTEDPITPVSTGQFRS